MEEEWTIQRKIDTCLAAAKSALDTIDELRHRDETRIAHIARLERRIDALEAEVAGKKELAHIMRRAGSGGGTPIQ